MKSLLPLTIFLLLTIIGFSIVKNVHLQIPTSSPTPIANPFPYKIPKIPSKRSYLTFLVGDSIIAALGLNDNGLREDLIKYYPDHEFVNYNYGFPSTNIESLPI